MPTCSRIISVVLAHRCSHLYRLTYVGRLFHTCETNEPQMWGDWTTAVERTSIRVHTGREERTWKAEYLFR